MTEKQDIKVSNKLKTSNWCFLAEINDWRIYETLSNQLFAVSTKRGSDKVSFEVYPDEEEEYTVY